MSLTTEAMAKTSAVNNSESENSHPRGSPTPAHLVPSGKLFYPRQLTWPTVMEDPSLVHHEGTANDEAEDEDDHLTAGLERLPYRDHI